MSHRLQTPVVDQHTEMYSYEVEMISDKRSENWMLLFSAPHFLMPLCKIQRCFRSRLIMK